MSDAEATANDSGHLTENIVRFGRLLRAAGLPVTTRDAIDATEAVATAGVKSQIRFYWILHAAFVKRRSEQDIFAQAFTLFWRDPAYVQRMMQLMIPETRVPTPDQDRAVARRLSEALAKSHDVDINSADTELEFPRLRDLRAPTRSIAPRILSR